ncbi:MAG: Fis family transcriptional regulator [Myxococcota bacterium]|nr:Fis family transcriptional regulator [Myxococcota bacterium]
MTYHGYSESDLVVNRASLLLWGGSVHDRRAWAEEAQRCFEGEGPLGVVSSGAELPAALLRPRGVVLIADISVLSQEQQGRLVRCLQEREERPKFVIALTEPPQQAMNQGRLRGDLWYRLSQAQVDLTPSELKDAIRARRQVAEAAAAKVAKATAVQGVKTAPKKAAAHSVKAPVRSVTAPVRSVTAPVRGAKAQVRSAKSSAKPPAARVTKAAPRAKARPAKKR